MPTPSSSGRDEHLRVFLGQADQLVNAWRAAARNALAKSSDPVALDNLSVQSAAVAQALGVVTQRAEEFAAALLEVGDRGPPTG